MDNKVKVISTVDYTVGFNSPTHNLRRTWKKKNQPQAIDKDVLEEIMYEPGIEYLFREGLLYIEDMETKKELGLEPLEAEEPVNIIVLSDVDKRKWMVIMPIADFKEKVSALTKEQRNELVEYAIRNKLQDYEKCAFLKELTGRDIIKAIQLSVAAEEDTK